jgi:hypothetical protein
VATLLGRFGSDRTNFIEQISADCPRRLHPSPSIYD